MKYFFLFICFMLGLSNISWALEITDHIDFGLEPILSSQWVCYIKNGNVYIQKNGIQPVQVSNVKGDSVRILSPALQAKEKTVFVSWIEQQTDGNKLYLARITDSTSHERNTVALTGSKKATFARLLPIDNGRVVVLEGSLGKNPELALHISPADRMEFKTIQLAVPDLDYLFNPSLIEIHNVYYLFYYGMKGERGYVGTMTYDMASMQLKESAMLKEVQNISFFEAFSGGHIPFVFYKTVRQGNFVIEGIAKNENGWDSFSLKDTDGLDVARMDCHIWDDDRILIVFSGEEKEKFKQRIYAAVSHDRGKSWITQRIDNKDFDNTRSWLPRMAVDGSNVAVVWEDSRDIRSAIRLRLSADRGSTWTKNDSAISGKTHYAFRPRISFADHMFNAVWYQFGDDEKRTADLAFMKFNWAEAVQIASRQDNAINSEKKRTLLRERVETYWKAMIEKDLKTSYMLHDPFYRARIPFDYYSAHRGPMVYQSFSIENIRIEGNIADVRVTVRYEIPRFAILGKNTSVPPRDVMTEDTYLFIDGAWHRKFVDALSGGSAIDY